LPRVRPVTISIGTACCRWPSRVAIEIIGEAAARISPETKGRCPEIPWTSIVGARNWLIHAYFDINLDRVWDTITDDLPKLVVELKKIPLENSNH